MRYMNEYEINDAVARFADHPYLRPATQTLHNLMVWTNQNSDGWAYWPKPCRAAAKLQELIEGGDRFDDEREDVTPAMYAAALRPIKAFRTKHGATFEIIEPGEIKGPPTKSYYTETKGFGQVRCEWIEATDPQAARKVAMDRHGVSVVVTSEK